MPPNKADKGKAKAKPEDRVPSEATPLLADAHAPSTSTYLERAPSPSTRPAQSPPPSFLRRHLLTILIVLNGLVLSLLLGLILLAYSFVPSESERADLDQAVAWHGPDAISVVNVSDTGIWVKIDGSLSINTDVALGLKASSSDISNDDSDKKLEETRGHGAEWWETLRTLTGHWAISIIGPLSVTLPEAISLYPSPSSPIAISTLSHAHTQPLLSFHLAETLPIPFTPAHNSTPSPISFLVHVEPLTQPGRLLQLAQEAWKNGWVEVVLDIPEVKVARWRGGGFMGDRLSYGISGLKVPLNFDIDDIPGLPSRDTNLSSLISLKSYSFRTVTSTSNSSVIPEGGDDPAVETRLAVEAMATIPNILEGVRGSVPYGLGFGVYLRALPRPEEQKEGDGSEFAKSQNVRATKKSAARPAARTGLIKMADVITLPISLRGQKTIELRIQGFITSDLDSSDESNESALSGFLRNYLEGEDNDVTIIGLPRFPKGLQQGRKPPGWIQEVLPNVNITVAFPGPKPKPQLIRSVTIENMKIAQKDKKMVASGTVIAQIQLPNDMASIDVDVDGVLPDVLIFDGAIPEEDGEIDPDETPYPLKAFGRINPQTFLPSSSVRSQEPQDLGILIVRAPLVDVPLDVLPGRDKVLSDFVSKVIFKGGALAGVGGNAGVRVKVTGVGGEVALDGLPVKGEVVIGKPR